MNKKNFFSLVILTLFSLVLLTSCTKTTAKKSVVEDKTINYIELVDKNGEYTFASSNNVIDYKENLSFNANDFTLKIHYANGSTEEIQSGFTFTLYKIDNTEEVVTGNLLPGSYKISVVYNNAPQEVLFSISPITLNKDQMTVSLENSYTFIPNESIEPDIEVTFNNKTLIKDTDYEIVYGSNASIGKNQGLVIINGKGIYSGSVQYNFEITKRNMGVINLPTEVNYTYDGKDPRITIEEDFSNVEGVSSVEYQYFNESGGRVFDISTPGTYQVKVKVNPQYGYNSINTKTFTLTVNPFDISIYTLEELNLTNMQMPYIDSPYTTDDLEDYVSVRVTEFEYMLAMVSGDNIDCYHISTSTTHGEFKIKGVGYYTGEIVVPFTIVPLNISNASVIVESDTYTGSAIKVKVYYAFSSTFKELEESEDYTIEYENNVNAGTASYTITGLKDFGGSKVGTFTINKVSISPEDVYEWVDFYTLNYTYTGEVIKVDNLLVVKDGVTLDADNIFDIEYKAYYNDREVDIVHISNYLIKAIITIKNNNYEFPINGDTVPTSYEMSKDNLTIESAKATLTYTGKSSYEYTGERVGPTKDDVVITFGDYTLEEGADYVVTLPTSSTNVGNNYTVTISLYNLDFYLEGSFWSDISYTYSITPTEVKASALTIEWPDLYKEVWHNHFYIQTQGSVKYNSATLTSEFFVGIRQIPGESGWYANSLICYIRDENYKLLDEDNNELSDREIILYMGAVSGHPELPYVSGYTVTNNYFSSFEVDGQELNADQIEAIYTSGKINYNQALNITMASGYKIQYQSYSNIDGKDKGWSEMKTSLTLNVGSDLDLNGDPFEMHEIREVFFKLSKDDDEDFRAEVHLGVVRVEFTSEETKHYDGTPYELTYIVYPQGYQVKLMFVNIVGGAHYDISGDIINQGTYGVYVELYNGDPNTSPLAYRETLFTFSII